MDYLKTPVEVRIHWAAPASGKVVPTIEITDRMSNRVIANIPMSGEDFTELLASRAAYSIAELLPKPLYDKVGMRMEVRKIEAQDGIWPEEWLRREGVRDKWGVKPDDVMNAWAANYIAAQGWDTFEWRKHNYGWGLLIRRYVETTEDERKARLKDFDF